MYIHIGHIVKLSCKLIYFSSHDQTFINKGAGSHGRRLGRLEDETVSSIPPAKPVGVIKRELDNKR